MIKIHTRLNRAWNNSCFNIEITFLWKSFRFFFLRSPYNNKLTKNLDQRSPHLFIFCSLRSSSIFKLQNFIKFACKQFQLDFNIFTIFYESSSKRDKKESYCRVYRRRGYILQHFSVSHLAKIEREEKMRGFWRVSDETGARWRRFVWISAIYFHQSWVSGMSGFGNSTSFSSFPLCPPLLLLTFLFPLSWPLILLSFNQ